MKPRISRPFASVPITCGASNPSRSRNRRSACTDGVHGPARRCTVSPMRTASFRFPPRDRSSAIAREGTRAPSRVRLRCVLAVAPADLAKLPPTPGVYLFVDARGRLLYIGRASSLRSRVRSYWSAGLDRPGLRRMVRRVRRVLAGSCVSEHEAALLERTLLERLDPPFNRTSGVETVVGVRLSTTPPAISAVVELAPRVGRVFGPYLGWAPTYAAAAALVRLFPVHFCRPAGELDSVQRDLARIRGVSENDLADLALVRLEGGDLSVDRPRDVEPDVRVACSEEQHARYPMLLQSAGELLGEEEMVARRDHTVEPTPSGNAVVGVDLVVAPGVVREDHVGPVLADDAAHLAAKIHAHLEFAVLVPEEDELFDADRFARRTLLALPRISHLLRRHFRIVRSLLAARDYSIGHVRARGADPRCKRARTPEVDVVRVSEDRHRPLWDGE